MTPGRFGRLCLGPVGSGRKAAKCKCENTETEQERGSGFRDRSGGTGLGAIPGIEFHGVVGEPVADDEEKLRMSFATRNLQFPGTREWEWETATQHA